jgi:fructosamine-3-kinase
VGAAEGPAAWADHFLERLVEVRGDPALAERLAPDVLARVDDAIELAPAALRDAGTPTLVHGDVWDGNLMVHVEDGRWRISGLLDPDLQYADVEYELAYLEALDTPRRAFFARYSDHHPLRPGYQQRRLFYWLLTGLLHVALFGDPVFCDFTARTAAAIGREVS